MRDVAAGEVGSWLRRGTHARAVALWAWLVVLTSVRASAHPVVVDAAFVKEAVGRHAELAYDPSGTATIDDVLAGKLAFASNELETPSFGYRAGAEWLHVGVDDGRARTDDLVLEHGYGQTDFVELFEVSEGRVVRHARAGDHVRPSEWDVLARFPAFELAPRAHHDFFVRLAGNASHQAAFTVYAHRAYEAHRRADLAVQSVYFGALMAMLVYNALVWLAVRSRAYASYVGFLGSFGAFQLFLAGFGPAAFGVYGVPCDLAMPLGMAAFGWFGLLFAEELLDLERSVPTWGKNVARFRGVFTLAIVGATGFGYSIAMRVALSSGLCWAPLMIVVGIVAHRRGLTVARLYLVAWGAFLAGTVVAASRALGLVPSNGITAYAQQLGSVLEFLLLSFALADRIKRLQAEATANAELAAANADLARLATTQVLAEQERANAELKRLDLLKDAFLANTSHELRTPLNGVIGLADSLLATAAELPRTTEQGLRTILASGRRLDRLVSDLMDFSKAKSGELAVELGAVNLSGCVSDALLLLAPNVGRKDVRLVNDVAPAFALARADETRLAQVLQHVVGNAIKFTETGEVRVAADRREGRLVLVVRDTGPGIAPERLASLFVAFEQGDGSATRAHGGTGLGLAFAKQLMELQGGTIEVASELGRGTTVSLVLVPAPSTAQATRARAIAANVRSIAPASSQRSVAPPSRRSTGPVSFSRSALASPLAAGRPRAEVASPLASAPLRAPRVLVADDEPVNLERLQMDLEPAGYELVCVPHGKAAVEAFDAQGPFDLVLLDVMMPELDGLAACRALRERAGSAELPVLLVTAKREAKDLEAGFSAGANDYVTKPYARQELLERCRAHLATARSARSMQRFVPTEFAKLLGHARVEDMALGDCTEKELTVLFLDIHGFTGASERMSSRQVFEWLNDQFRVIVPAIRAHGGFVDKFVGDALMGLFARGALPAVNAAADAMKKLREQEPLARVGIGLHHGVTMLGAIGDEARFSPTVVSDTVNVASRLENLTRRFDALVLLSDDTVEAAALSRSGRTRYLGAFRVKGRAKALRVHELLDAEDPLVAEEKRGAAVYLTRIHEALERGDLEGASGAAQRAQEAFPIDPVVAFYSEALAAMLQTGERYEGALELREK